MKPVDKSFYRIDVRVYARAPVFVAGRGRGLPLIDRTVEVASDTGLPIIPASSWRGRVRAEAERIIRAAGQFVCQPPSPMFMCPHHGEGQPDSGFVDVGVGPDAVETRFFCLACRIFGSPWLESSVVFSEMRPEVGVGNAARAEAAGLRLRTGVSVSRTLGTAEPERLYFYETSAEKLAWTGYVEGRLTPVECGVLAAALRSVSYLGGQKARGLGRVTMEIVGITGADGQGVQADELIAAAMSELLASDSHSGLLEGGVSAR